MFFDCINAEICLSLFDELPCDCCDMFFVCAYCSKYYDCFCFYNDNFIFCPDLVYEPGNTVIILL